VSSIYPFSDLSFANDWFSSSPVTNLSFGSGIEREALYGLWNRFIQNRSQFFVDREDGFCTIRCMTSFGGSSVSPARMLAMKQFGAVTALLLVHGQTPRPLSPAVMLFIIYNFDIHCLTPGFIGEWFAGLRTLLSNWLETGPDGDPEPFASHFATYHDAQVSFHIDISPALATQILFYHLF
jgi:hypothetical protein